MENYKFPGKINVVEILEQPDGSAKVVFEADKTFKDGFKKYYGLKRWSQKKFNLFLNQAIEDMNKRLIEELNEETQEKNKC